MESLLMLLCISFVFLISGGLHLYTMKKINTVQKGLLSNSQSWRDLEKASAGSLYTMLVLILVATFFGSILHKFVMVVLYQMYLYAVFN